MDWISLTEEQVTKYGNGAVEILSNKGYFDDKWLLIFCEKDEWLAKKVKGLLFDSGIARKHPSKDSDVIIAVDAETIKDSYERNLVLRFFLQYKEVEKEKDTNKNEILIKLIRNENKNHKRS